MKSIMLALGAVVVLVGLVWLLQGAGIIRYPAESFMIDQTPWIWRGAAVCLAGIALALYSRKR